MFTGINIQAILAVLGLSLVLGFGSGYHYGNKNYVELKSKIDTEAKIQNQITKQTFHSCNFEAIQIMSFFKIFCFIIFFIIMTNSTWVKFQTLRTLFMAISKIMRTVKHFLSRNRLIRILLIFIGF